MSHSNRSRGFTLIELLVVIAIIGILSAVVLASLNTARSKGSDASIQSNLDSIHTQAELYFGGSNTYGILDSSGSCTLANSMFVKDLTIAKAIAGADSANGPGAVKCEADGANHYLVAADLVATTSYWCIDANGTSKIHSGAVSTISNTAYACP